MTTTTTIHAHTDAIIETVNTLLSELTSRNPAQFKGALSVFQDTVRNIPATDKRAFAREVRYRDAALLADRDNHSILEHLEDTTDPLLSRALRERIALAFECMKELWEENGRFDRNDAITRSVLWIRETRYGRELMTKAGIPFF